MVKGEMIFIILKKILIIKKGKLIFSEKKRIKLKNLFLF